MSPFSKGCPIDLDALKAAGLNSRENSERLLAEHNAKLRLHWDLVRKFYAHYEPKILAAGANEWGMDTYAWDHEAKIVLTPIEASLWHDIRAADAVLYPQYPVDRFFVDFGNPIAKVAIECDGKTWHQDKAKDDVRQSLIEARGWTVYRFTGSQCHSIEVAVAIRRIAEQHGIARA